MSYANIFELNKCLEDCLDYCRRYPDRGHVEFHQSLLEDAKEQLERTSANADREFSQWKMESRDDKLAWKHLAKEFASVQRELRAVSAIGYFDQRVMYWNQERLLAAVKEMLRYLRQRTDALDFAADRADKLERFREKAVSEDEEKDRALDEYIQYSKLRSDGLTVAKDTIGNFRRALRRDLGTRDEDYQGIRWPHQVATDEKVL